MSDDQKNRRRRGWLFAVMIALAVLPAGWAAAETGPVTACFTPPRGCAAQIVAEIDAATTTVRAQLYTFTSHAIADALMRAHRRGVDVQVIADRSE